MLINSKSTSLLESRLSSCKEIFCRSLFLSARWFVLTQAAQKGLHFIILPNKEAAEYCSADLYSLTEGDRVFFLPASGKNIERSNYKSSLGVQRTSAIEKILNYDGSLLYIVTYPEAIERKRYGISGSTPASLRKSLYTASATLGSNLKAGSSFPYFLMGQ